MLPKRWGLHQFLPVRLDQFPVHHATEQCADVVVLRFLFGHFIPPGIWEAVYVIEGLMKSRSRIAATCHYRVLCRQKF
jgi:hypothetical protein